MKLVIARIVYCLDFKRPEPEIYGVEWANLGQGGGLAYGDIETGNERQDRTPRFVGDITKKQYGRHQDGEFQLWDQFIAAKCGPRLVFKVRDGGDREEISKPLERDM